MEINKEQMLKAYRAKLELYKEVIKTEKNDRKPGLTNKDIEMLKELEWEPVKHDGEYLIDDNGNRIGTKADFYAKLTMQDNLTQGTWDHNPRPHYKDGSASHTIFQTAKHYEYDLSKDSPLLTLRPIAYQSSIGESMWIYKDMSTDLKLLKDKYNISWWDSWNTGSEDNIKKWYDETKYGNIEEYLKIFLDSIGCTYGDTVRLYDLINKLIYGLKTNPDSRYHIIDLYQYSQFEKPHGLKPCAFLTQWTVRHEFENNEWIEYLDVTLDQRSSDFIAAGNINQLQYIALQTIIAKICNMKVGKFIWNVQNIQIYDRHIISAIEQLNRTPINCDAKFEIKKDIESLEDFTFYYDFENKKYISDIELINQPTYVNEEGQVKKLIPKLNPQQPNIKENIAI